MREKNDVYVAKFPDGTKRSQYFETKSWRCLMIWRKDSYIMLLKRIWI